MSVPGTEQRSRAAAPDELETLALGTLLASFSGPVLPDWLRRAAARGLGGVCLFGSNVAGSGAAAVAHMRALTDQLHALWPALVVATDEEGGDVTRLDVATGSRVPGAAVLGAVDDVVATERVHRALGALLAEAGVDLCLGPVADVNSNPANPVIGVRSFGAHPAPVARHVAAAVRGLQATGAAACVKHFPGHGDTSEDSHLALPVVAAGEELLRARELVPFRAAVQAGAAAVMTSHLVLPALDDVPATFSRRILHDLLRDELGFSGLVVTDALDMRGASAGRGVPAAAVAALAAGADLLCLGADKDEHDLDAVVAALVAAVRDGRLPEARLREAAARVAAVRGQRDVTVPAISDELSELSDPSELVALAARAVLVRGSRPRPARGWLVLELETVPGIAAGRVPWGLGESLARLDPTSSVQRVCAPPDGVGPILAAAAGRPLAVVARDARRHGWPLRLAEELAVARPDLVLVDVGWPPEHDVEVPTVLYSYGASVPSREAVARLLVEGT